MHACGIMRDRTLQRTISHRTPQSRLMCEKNNARRTPKTHDRIVCQKTMRDRALCSTGAIRGFKHRAADEACTARVNANKFKNGETIENR